jgi:hypothetical protein
MRSSLDAPSAVVLIAALVAGSYLRMADLSQMLFFGDEFLSLCRYGLPWTTLASSYDQGGTGVPLPLLQKASAALLGANELTLRLPALVPGILAIPAVFLLSRCFFARFAAALCTLLFAVSHYAIYYSTVGRIYSLYLLLAIVAITLVLEAARRPRPSRATTLALLFGLMFYCHLTSAALLAICGLYAIGVLLARRATRRDWLLWAFSLSGAGLLALALHFPAMADLTTFLSAKLEPDAGRGIDFVEILELYAGGGLNAALFAILIAIGLIAGFVERRPHRGLVAWAIVASAAVLLLVEPVGHSPAHARYVIYVFPLLLVPLMDGLLLVSRKLADLVPGSRRGPVAALTIGGFALLYWAAGFEGYFIDRGSNIDRLRSIGISRVDLPVPALYRELAVSGACSRVIEFPFFRIRVRRSAQLLFMRYRAVHGRDVYIGEAVDTGAMNRYVDIYHIPAALLSGSCLVFHKDIRSEVQNWNQAHSRSGLGGEKALPVEIRPACWFGGEETVYDMEKILGDLRGLYGSPWREDDALAIFRPAPQP